MSKTKHLKRARELCRSGFTAIRLVSLGVDANVVRLVRAMEKTAAARQLREIGRKKGRKA